MYEKLQSSADKDNEASSSKRRTPLKIKGKCTSKFYRTIELSISVEILSKKLNIMFKKNKVRRHVRKVPHNNFCSGVDIVFNSKVI